MSAEKELQELKLRIIPRTNKETIVKEGLSTSDTVENKQFPCHPHCGHLASSKKALKKHIRIKHI